MTYSSQPASQQALYDKLVAQERVIQSAAMPQAETPSCLNLFDRWATCFALTPQFTHVYRYGVFNDCADKLDDFKFCLTLKGLDRAQRHEAFVERKARAMATRRMPGGDTSEEIWTLRQDNAGNGVVDPTFVDPAFLQANLQQDEGGKGGQQSRKV
ncbi:hypothetical protein BDZ90DRAFT_233369 [Jaminaea rosea]|uniref:Uncharacterized protein n=1 Tax=Jaminaea rosea TaxID=1569628 RepID=A0A316ULV2_9BASI|nr:hypothetical protein BDZ90DRAFT_233369 [Jaminaea rosea]PWN26237.1 hypothetical protein BDZ90DRAFT_233369 [Jaminaea rosea]